MLRQPNKILCALSALLLVITISAESDYKGQFEQDKFFNELFFKNKKDGVFIDIGAHDGITGSNTWFFEKKLGWKGICIEPLPNVFKNLTENRNCICVNAAMADKEGSATFRQVTGYSEMLSGIEANYDSTHKERIEKEIVAMGGSYQYIEVPTVRLSTLLEKNTMYHIDFMSLDIEGGELEVLKTIDFKRFYIAAIAVENNYQTTEMREFLESQGFRFVARVHIDEMYINKREFPLKNKEHKKKQDQEQNHEAKHKEQHGKRNKQLVEIDKSTMVQCGKLLLIKKKS